MGRKIETDLALSFTESRLMATAYHEAGHAVMALYLGRALQKITIVPARLQTGKLRLGACQIKKGQPKSSLDRLEQEVLILLAGMVAESHFTDRYCTGSAAGDLVTVRRMLTARAKSERQLERLERRYLEKTEHILADTVVATAIQKIAAELIEHETISGRAARHLYDQACRKRFG